MSDSKKYFFPLAVVCILVVIFLVRCGKGSNANNISFTTEQQEEIKTIVDHVSSWSKDLPISPARKPNKIAITQCNGKPILPLAIFLVHKANRLAVFRAATA